MRKYCRRWIIGNFVSDNGVFVVKDECHKNQQTLLNVPWTGRTIIEEKCDEFEGDLMYLTQSEESLIKKSCSKTWRSAESKLVQPRIMATKTDPQGKKQRMFQEDEGFYFRKAAIRHVISVELRRFSPDSVIIHLPDVCCRIDISLTNQQ